MTSNKHRKRGRHWSIALGRVRHCQVAGSVEDRKLKMNMVRTNRYNESRMLSLKVLTTYSKTFLQFRPASRGTTRQLLDMCSMSLYSSPMSLPPFGEKESNGLVSETCQEGLERSTSGNWSSKLCSLCMWLGTNKIFEPML